MPSGKVEEALDEWHDLVRRAVAIILTICTCDVELILFNVIGEAQDAAVSNRVWESALKKRYIGVAELLPEAADEDLRVRDRQCDEGESSMHRHPVLLSTGVSVASAGCFLCILVPGCNSFVICRE